MSEVDERIHNIMELLMAYARLDFDHQVNVDTNDDELTAIGAGINMLGEELKANTISLREKERLLKELHHRVKNNMQIIISMMRLQTINEKDPKILGFVRDSKARIDSMALVHEMLYSSEGFEYTRFDEYVDFLHRSIFMSYAPPKHEIVVEVNIPEDCFFNIDRMIPLGLIVNELLTNSLKHAFPDKKGKIQMTVLKKEDSYSLEFKDDGVGLPKDLDIENLDSLGLQLIQMLVDQIDGEQQISVCHPDRKDRSGVKFKIDF